MNEIYKILDDAKDTKYVTHHTIELRMLSISQKEFILNPNEYANDGFDNWHHLASNLHTIFEWDFELCEKIAQILLPDNQ